MVVRVRTTLPAAISAGLGVYTAFRLAADGLNDPLPPLQRPPVAPLTVPASWALGWLAQLVSAGPASASGAGVMVMTTWSLTGLLLPLPTDVRVRVTLPAAISAALGV